MSYRANATKPERNKSLIVDLNKRNLKTELTATIPDNDDLVIEMRHVEGTDYYYGCEAFGVLSTLNNSKLFQYFVNCFDQMKIMDCHYCIDETWSPSLAILYNGMNQVFESAQFSIDGGVTWNDYNVANPAAVYYPGHNGDANYTILSAEQAAYMYGTFHNQVVNFDQPKEMDLQLYNVIAAASRRGIPEGFYQVGNNPFRLPSYEELMSYGSVIYQSKLPGAQIHLSLDVAGTSNSERMMTFPTQMINRLSLLTPALQNGRFCPIIYIGVRAKVPDFNTQVEEVVRAVNSDVTDTYLDYGDGVGTYTIDKFAACWYYINIPGTYNGNAVTNIFRIRCSYNYNGFTEEQKHEKVQGILNAATRVSVQGYHSCRFKQLRTMASDKSFEFAFVGVNIPVINRQGFPIYGTASTVASNFAFNQNVTTSCVGVMRGPLATYDFSNYNYNENDDDEYYIFGMVLMRRSGDAIETMVISLQKYTDATLRNVHFVGTQIQTFYNNLSEYINQYEKCILCYCYRTRALDYFVIDGTGSVAADVANKQLDVYWSVDQAGNSSGQNLSKNGIYRTVDVTVGNVPLFFRISTAAFYNTEVKLN